MKRDHFQMVLYDTIKVFIIPESIQKIMGISSKDAAEIYEINVLYDINNNPALLSFTCCGRLESCCAIGLDIQEIKKLVAKGN